MPHIALDTLHNAYNRQHHVQAMIALCARRRLPLSATEWPELRDLILSGNPVIADDIKLSRRQLGRLLIDNYKEYYKQLQSSLQNTQSMIHLSTDMWSSPAR